MSKDDKDSSQLNACVTNLLKRSLCKEIQDTIFEMKEIRDDAHHIWITLKDVYGEPECDDKVQKTSESLEGSSTPSTSIIEPQVTSLGEEGGQKPQEAASLEQAVEPLVTGGLTACHREAEPMCVMGDPQEPSVDPLHFNNNDHQLSEETTSPNPFTSSIEHFSCFMAKVEKCSEKENEVGEYKFGKMSKKDKEKIAKLMELVVSQKEMIEGQQAYLRSLNDEFDKYKLVNVSLIKKCKSLNEECTRATNSLSCVAQLKETNRELVDNLVELTSKHGDLQNDHIELLKSHEKLMDAHAMLEIAHEVVLTSVKFIEPLSHTCTCSLVNNDLSCANICVDQASQSSIEHVCVETCDDLLIQENDELKKEVERLNKSLSELKGKNQVQPSQDNRDNMVKKLEKGSTDTCSSPHQDLKINKS